jgi:UDPglucose--hexose-1-phosphate uridylyltransferase
MVTKEWVIIATERAKRPEQFKSAKKEKEPLPEYDPKCPFCPGFEDKTPPETYRVEKDGRWLVRSFPNKFAALVPEGDTNNHFSGVLRKMTGVGFHEVIAETPLHNQHMAMLDADHLASVIEVYHHRFNHIADDPRIEQVIVFKNHGAGAGTSLIHPHSQLIALPMVPAHIRHRVEEAMRYFDDHGRCVMCEMMQMELEEGTRIIEETEHFVSFCPYASFSPFHVWIVPKEHHSCFGHISDEIMPDMAKNLKGVLQRLYHGLNDPDFNLVVNSAPLDGGTRYYHWYVSVVPRVTKTAGFELGSGMFINVSLPEENAEYLRSVEIET